MEEIIRRVQGCARLPALASTNNALCELLSGDEGSMQHVAEVIRRDPSLTSRLLKLVNSVCYGLSRRITSIEQAVLYLGMREVRHVATITPLIDQFQVLTANTKFTWKQFWQHCIGTAMLTQELLDRCGAPPDDSPYIAGLLHDIGKIVMAAVFPMQFRVVRHRINTGEMDLLAVEMAVLGMDHAELGALYLEHHLLDPALVAAARFHHRPAVAREPAAAAVQIADLVLRHAELGRSGNPATPSRDDCLAAEGWRVLLPDAAPARIGATLSSLDLTVARMPLVLDSLV